MSERSEIPCAQIRQRISRYVDSELTPNEARDVSEHLHGCAECRREEEALRGLWNALGDVIPVKPSATLVATVLQRIDEEDSAEDDIPVLLTFRRLLPVSAAVAVLCLIGGGLLGRAIMEKEAVTSGHQSIAETLDIFAPAPRGTLANGYFAMMHNPGS